MLTSSDIAVLRALDEDGGFTTGEAARRSGVSFGHNNHTRSGAVRAWLLHMQKEGLVRPLDNQKPVAWVRTSLGSRELKLWEDHQ